MARVIKFRIWNQELNEMYTLSKENYLGFTGLADSYVGAKEAIWMQFTGLHDKNDVEIYEGDIVHFKRPDVPFVVSGNGYLDSDIEQGFELKGEIKFLYGCWFIDEGNGKGCPLDFDENQVVEVIGNKYEQK
ncbi:YopX family protein [Mesobacillus subterraneus]|uniref:YopX family protein n=1 Tax=Mesobacillus subterraneus TaxID=285983 RepID=UPI00203BCB82|nr:YopX family protein [Mesobacillus subterraneus]MCM3665547.1 YopX family protein [Mesobacillus subterraneus]MCM3686106.1 YopX family protein [Mesobacillus subterraneus]